MEKGAILIVDDEEDILLSLQMYLSIYFERVDIEKRPQKIPQRFETCTYDLVLLDMNFRKGDTAGEAGMSWLQQVKTLSPGTSVIMMTAYADIPLAVEAVKQGAVDFIEKPWRNEKLLATILAGYRLSQTQQTLVGLKSKQRELIAANNKLVTQMIGESPAILKVFNLIEKVAKTDANALILGENGTGKELVAREIHAQSSRANASFVKIDVGAIPETLFESELFGHKKGAFTDAREDRMGQFEVASGGTLFLDEIGNLALPLQSKLLSALQNRQIRRLGASEQIPIDIRLICATNMPLNQMVQERRFRQDLLYRINTVVIDLPPLRERRSDIPLLAIHFLNTFKQKYQKASLKIDQDTMKKLEEYSWPGNIRELRHAIERAVILSDKEEIFLTDFIAPVQNEHKLDYTDLEEYNLEEIEKWAIRKVMVKHRGNISRAADELGLTRATLYRRIEKYGL